MSQSSSVDAQKPGQPAKDNTAPFSRPDLQAPQKTAAPGQGATAKNGAGQAPANQPKPQAQQQKAPVRPPVESARFETRHIVLALSFLLLVILPTLIAAGYLWTRAEDRYVSTVGFSVRKEDSSPSLDVLGGLTQITGSTSATDTDILYDFLRSEDIVARIDAAVDLRALFSKEWPNDPFFAFDPSGTIEDLTNHWHRHVKVLHDSSTQLITLKVSAYTPEDALTIAKATFDESTRTINRLSDIAREDATRFARDELAATQERLTEARQALTAFRMRTQIVDPAADLEGQMGILNSLQGGLAEALIELDTLRENANDSDQRVIQAEKRIEAIRARIAEERAKFGASNEGPAGESYAQLVAEYEKLASELEFDLAAYHSAQAAYDIALAEARRQSRYLAAHIEPNLAQASLVPNRPAWLLSIFGALLLGWSILLLIYYSVRDRR